MSTLHTQYRPKTLDEIIGHEAIVKSLQYVLKRKTSRAFIFEGQYGLGKTTLARIVARSVGCSMKSVVEVDAATNTGIDAMREVTGSMIFSAIGEKKKKMFIIDEAHMLSKQAWTSLLKSAEEPPPHVYWAFCTSDGAKIPAGIRSRCVEYRLGRVDKDKIHDLLRAVAKKEGFDTPDDVLYLIAEKSEGSPRQALTCLAQCAGCQTRKEAAELIRKVADDTAGEAIDLCRAIAQGKDWPELMQIVTRLSDVGPESIRYAIIGYFSKVAMGAKTAKAAESALAVLDAFQEPYPAGTTQLFPVILSLGRLF